MQLASICFDTQYLSCINTYCMEMPKFSFIFQQNWNNCKRHAVFYIQQENLLTNSMLYNESVSRGDELLTCDISISRGGDCGFTSAVVPRTTQTSGVIQVV